MYIHIYHVNYMFASSQLAMHLHFQIPLGIILRNENKLDEMTEIMEHLHKYVPFETCAEQFQLASGEELTIASNKMHHILIGGDQLTVARIRSVQEGLLNSNSPRERMEGLVPVVEDWHAKVIFLKVRSTFLSL